MAVTGNRKRSANVGHHLDGSIVTYPDGTEGFRQNTSITDVVTIQNTGAQLDAFSRLRVSEPTTLFNSQSQYDDGTKDDWYHAFTTGGSAIHLPDQSSVRMATTATAGASVIRQTQRYIRYQPGKSQLIFITFDFEAVDGGTKRAGYYDGENGFYFELAASGALTICRRSYGSGAAVDTKIAQASWSEDPLDGNGPSGVTLDATKSQIVIIDLQWLAVGRVRMGFDIDGTIYYAHHFEWANANSGVYMTTANLPVRYELIGNGSATQMQSICASVSSEGGFVVDVVHEHVTPAGTTGVSCPVTVNTHVISIRPKLLFNSITNRGQYAPEGISFYVTSKPVLLRMYRGSALTGGAWASSDTESGMEYNIGATAVGGHLTNSEFGAAAGGGKAFSTSGGAQASNRTFLSLDIAGANVDSSNFTVTGTGIGGTATVYCNLHWTEIK